MLFASFLIAFGAAIAALTAMMTASNYNSLPDRIPTHFGFSPQPDSYGPKPMAWMLPIVQIIVLGSQFFVYKLNHPPSHAMVPAVVIADAVALTILAAQWLIIETAKNGPSGTRYRTFWFVFALTMLVVPVSIAFGK